MSFKLGKRIESKITFPVGPRKKEPDSATGLKAKEAFISSKKLFLSGLSGINVELLPWPFEINGNFPVVGDGCACNEIQKKKKYFNMCWDERRQD